MFLQGLDITAACLSGADRVDAQYEVAQSKLFIQRPLQIDDLDVRGRRGITDAFDAELPELAVAAGLRAVVTEHRPVVEEPHRLRAALHAVLQVGAADGRRALRTQR